MPAATPLIDLRLPEAPAPLKCCAEGCSEVATRIAVLELYSLQKTGPRIHRLLQALDVRLDDMGLCPEHGRTFTAEDIMTDDLWKILAARLAQNGVKGQRHRTKLKLGPLSP